MEMQRKERLNEKESREGRKTARRKSIEVWATDCERAVEPINRADFMSGFDDGWLSAIKYASQQRWVEVADERNNAWDEFLDLSAQAGYNIKNTLANRALFMSGFESGTEKGKL